MRELFHVAYWLAHTYARGAKPAPGLAFDPNALPKTTPLPKQTIDQLQRLKTELRERDEKLSSLLANKATLDEELQRLRAEVAEAKKANTAQADTHNYSEAETRDYFIDLLLKEAGWALDTERERELPVEGMPNTESKGFVDYVLWGDDGIPLALVEAKRTKRDPRVGQRQAELCRRRGLFGVHALACRRLTHWRADTKRFGSADRQAGPAAVCVSCKKLSAQSFCLSFVPNSHTRLC